MKMTNTKTCLTLIAGLALAQQASADPLGFAFGGVPLGAIVENQFAQYGPYWVKGFELTFLAQGVHFDDGIREP